MSMTSKQSSHVHDLVFIALGAVLIAVCSWITIPSVVPFTLQTMAVFLVCGLLGGARGTISVVIYILLGIIGIPVFSGFRGGIGHLLGTTGGYIIGFVFSALVMWLLEKVLGKKLWVLALSMVLGLLVCYAFGTAWFYIVYQAKTGPIGLGTVLGWCVIPFIIPDLVKIIVALILTGLLRQILKKARISL